MNTIPSNTPHLIPLSKWNDHHPYPTVSALRNLVFKAEENGFHRCIRRIGRRIFIDAAIFFEWVEEQNKQAS